MTVSALSNTDSTLPYDDAMRSLSPIPYSERGLPTATAQPYFKVSDEPLALEGPAFDIEGNLLFLDIYGGRVLRLSPHGDLKTVYTDSTLRPAGIAIHRDGRIFLAGVGDFEAGAIIAIDAEGKHQEVVVGRDLGYVPDDLVFDEHGGFYFTDFKGTATQPTGGVYYVAPGQRNVIAALPYMSGANGVALSPDGSVLWATEFCASRLHRVDLQSPAVAKPFGSTVPYHFVGRAPDSMRVDRDGNVYVAMYQQGRVLVLNPSGIPIAQIVLPGYAENRFLKCTSMAFVPGRAEIVIVSRDESGGGAMIFRAGALAPGTRLFSHS
jgi:lactonase